MTVDLLFARSRSLSRPASLDLGLFENRMKCGLYL
jgi:hypothetical protein